MFGKALATSRLTRAAIYIIYRAGREGGVFIPGEEGGAKEAVPSCRSWREGATIFSSLDKTTDFNHSKSSTSTS